MKVTKDSIIGDVLDFAPATAQFFFEIGNEKVGGKPFGFTIGMDLSVDIDKEYGGLVGLYHECIKQGKTWEELLGTDGNWDEIPLDE